MVNQFGQPIYSRLNNMLNQIKRLDLINADKNFSDEQMVIIKIKDLITSRQLGSGDKLPSERALSEKFGVSRNQVRSAIQKLEFYGLVKKLPQSGTVVSSIGITAMNGMMQDILKLQEPDFKSLVESRILLEKNAVKLAAKRRTDEALYQLEEALNNFSTQLLKGNSAVEEDMMFHLKLVEASGNSVIHSMMLIIIPEIITFFMTNRICDDVHTQKLIKEHREIFEAIRDQKPEEAVKALEVHFVDLNKYCYS